MISIILTVPERFAMAQALSEQTAYFCRETYVLNDVAKIGCTWNATRALQLAQEKAQEGEAVLICTDDTVLCTDFAARFEALHTRANAAVYSFCIHYKHHVLDAILLKKSYKLTRHHGHFSDIGFVLYPSKLPENLAGSFSDWSQNRARTLKPWRNIYKHFDLAFGLYLEDQQIPFCIPVPALTKHNQAVQSSLNQNFDHGDCYFVDDVVGQSQETLTHEV